MARGLRIRQAQHSDTVGDGDVHPVVTVGRVAGVFTVVVGIPTFAIITAKVAEFVVPLRL